MRDSVGKVSMYGVVLCKMRRSTTLDGVQRSVMGLYDAASVGVLVCFLSVMILPSFQICVVMQCGYESFAMLLSNCVPWGQRCYK